MKKNIKRTYINDLRHHLLYVGSVEKKSLQLLNTEIENFINENTTYNDLVEKFGDPQELAKYYMEDYDEVTLKKKIKLKKIILMISTAILLTLILFIVFIIINSINAENSYITREQEIITED